MSLNPPELERSEPTRPELRDVPDLRDIVARHERPAVTLLVPLDHRRPMNRDDELRLRRLHAEVVTRVSRASDPTTVARLVARLERAFDAVDLSHPPPGVAILASPDRAHVIALRATVPERVVVADSFALLDILAALEEATRARALVLSLDETRLVDVVDGRGKEHLGDGFPVTERAPVEADVPHGDFPLDEHERDEAYRFVFRAVADALERAQRVRPMPLVILGTERDLAYFDQLGSRHGEVVGRVVGNHVRDTPDAIARLVATVLDAHVAQRRRERARDALEAIGARALAGLEAVARAARDGRGRTLVVESGLGGADRVVEDVIGHGGDVEVVAPGALRDAGGIVLVLRY